MKIEIDIEPTDKVYLVIEKKKILFKKQKLNSFILKKVERIKERVEEKEGSFH